MSRAVLEELSRVLQRIDRPGTFCASGSAPAVLPGLEVAGLGPVGLPLTPQQAEELKKLCEQAPYGKGEETLVDTNVRRVWRLAPDRFALTNPDWEQFLKQTVRKVQQELGLERRKLESHLHDLLLYEPGSFFLPHRDGEKLDRMVATLVVVLPSSFRGGELVVRHEGQERTIDFGGDSPFRVHFAAFYADCEHEIRPLREGHRLCLVYNLTLAKSKSKKPLTAPRSSEPVERIAGLLREWAEAGETRKLVVTLDHQYTQDGLTWDALKGADRGKAQALAEAAGRAGCQAHLALLTLHESGAAEGDYDYGRRRRRWYADDEEGDAGLYEMGEIYETSLTADHWSDPDDNRLPIDPLPVEEDEVLEPEAIRDVDPEEEFEGYTGNEGMTLDRWYRHAAVVLWADRRHFEVLCDAGIPSAVRALEPLVRRWRQAGRQEAAALRAQCLDFAAAIIARWPDNPAAGAYPRAEPAGDLFPSLVALDEPRLIRAYLGEVLAKDATADPGESLAAVCKKHGWGAFRPELEAAFRKTTTRTLERNVRLLEHVCLAGPAKDAARAELCAALARALVSALEEIDRQPDLHVWGARLVNRADVLAGLARSLLAAGQGELLSRVVDHALARRDKYPLTLVHVAALTALQPWLAQNVKEPCPALAHWLDSCLAQLESLTAQAPQPPADFRRPAALPCRCADCAELSRFLDDPHEQVHRFPAPEARRRHLEDMIRQHHCDLDCKTERKGRPYTLVCTKNRASYQANLATFRQNQEHRAALRAIRQSLPK
jgi:hypothetical protein